MGRRWWQKQARANATQDLHVVKEVDAVVDENAHALESNSCEDVSNNDASEVTDSIDESVAILAQTVEDADTNEDSEMSQDEDVIEEELDNQVNDVKVPGITITRSSNTYQNIKKKRKN